MDISHRDIYSSYKLSSLIPVLTKKFLLVDPKCGVFKLIYPFKF